MAAACSSGPGGEASGGGEGVQLDRVVKLDRRLGPPPMWPPPPRTGPAAGAGGGDAGWHCALPPNRLRASAASSCLASTCSGVVTRTAPTCLRSRVKGSGFGVLGV